MPKKDIHQVSPSAIIQESALAPPPHPLPAAPEPFLSLTTNLSRSDLSLSMFALLFALFIPTPCLLKVGNSSHLPLHPELKLSYRSGARA